MAEFKLSRIRYTWKGEWSSSETYYVDDIVLYGGKAYVCLVTHTTESGGSFYQDLTQVADGTIPPAPEPRWTLMFDGFVWTGDWAPGTAYNLGDIVKYGGIVYRCIDEHTAAATTDLGLEANQSDWEELAALEDWKKDWTVSTRYKVNDVVKYGGIVYRCIIDHTSAVSESQGLEIDLTGTPKWEVVHEGIEYRGTWATETRYKLYDVVKYGGYAWKCTTQHTSSLAFDEPNWGIYAPGLEYENNWSNLTVYQPGDVVKYGGYTYTSKTHNVGANPLTETSDWEILMKAYNFRGEWSDVVPYKIGDVVRRHGNLFVAVNDGMNEETTNETYWEEIVQSDFWAGDWQTGTTFLPGDVTFYVSNTYLCITKHVSSSANRPDKDTFETNWIVLIGGDPNNRLSTQGDIKTYDITEDGSTIGLTRLPVGTSGNVLRATDESVGWNLFGAVTKTYYVSINGIDSPTRGSTINDPFRTIKYACDFIQADLASRAPATINVKTGYYEEILPISVPADVAVVGDELRSTTIAPASGYENEDMFYVRNGSGIRNCTLQGLTGTLGGLNEYLTRRPNGGAFVSLDPGTGSADNSTWITTRSPYIQNVTTFGTGCVGLKVDGSLHDGGNKSIVANDFTQVLSDGIGAWITQGGRSELVSVFSYYGHIGYLAEYGGKIRATNGNSSYGEFGCVAEGVDPNEVPITAQTNNRYYEATVASALSGNIGDEILILEYEHCGQGYTNATYSFTGSGLNASGNSNIRNGGVSEVRILTPGDSSASGGGGYLRAGNNAQAGDDLTITIASNDTNLPENYEGMRIIIESGTGTGQYGYIYDYDAATKVATVYKESDNTPGWDHVAGFSIELVLDTSTFYFIEPRVTFSAPPSGTTALGRVVVSSGRITLLKIWDCGSGYTDPPTVTITDPNNTSEVILQARINDGVLGPLLFSNRGTGYQTVSTRVTINGDGFADKYQLGKFLVVSGASLIPGPGDNLNINEINDVTYKIVDITTLGGTAGNYDLQLQISPTLGIEESPAHDTQITIRQDYSQCRLTGHDFLDIGTGNFTSTDYPDLYVFGTSYFSAPENEVVEKGGGRVFYTSTDQDGNFRVGELFKVEQATGTVTISADVFNLSGLEELALGGVTVGGTGVVIREFSTDSTFTADSNNIVPTQRAIKAYLTSKISGGDSDAFTTQITAGTVKIGPFDISSTTVNQVAWDAPTKWIGAIDGQFLGTIMFANEFDSGCGFEDVGKDNL